MENKMFFLNIFPRIYNIIYNINILNCIYFKLFLPLQKVEDFLNVKHYLVEIPIWYSYEKMDVESKRKNLVVLTESLFTLRDINISKKINNYFLVVFFPFLKSEIKYLKVYI